MEKRLPEAMSAMDIHLSKRPNQIDSDRLYAIRADFQRMTDYWKKGYKDPQLMALYNQLLARLYVIYADASLNYALGQSTFLSSVYMRHGTHQHMLVTALDGR